MANDVRRFEVGDTWTGCLECLLMLSNGTRVECTHLEDGAMTLSEMVAVITAVEPDRDE